MKKSILFLFFVLLFSACGAQSPEIVDFEASQQSTDAIAENIANYLADFAEIKDCNVQIDGGTAVIGLDLAYKMSDAELVALKKHIVSDIKSQNNQITHVAVNTTPDLLENMQNEIDGGRKSAEEREIERELGENDDEEIFVNIAPTL